MKKGQSILEYGIALAVVAVVAVAVMTSMSTESSNAAGWLEPYMKSFQRP